MRPEPGFVSVRPWGRVRCPAAHSPKSGGGRGEGKLPDARPGVVRAPLGGSGQTLALTIPTGDELHAHVAAYGRRWPRSTYTISPRSRLSRESRSRRDRDGCREATQVRRELHGRAVRLLKISSAQGIVLIRPGERERRPAARSPFVGSPPEVGKFASARLGAVQAPTGGSGQTLAPIISKGAELHAQVAVDGRRWPRSTYTISPRSRLSRESRSRRDRDGCREAT